MDYGQWTHTPAYDVWRMTYDVWHKSMKFMYYELWRMTYTSISYTTIRHSTQYIVHELYALMSYAIHHMSCVIHHMSYVICHTPYDIRYTAYAIPVCHVAYVIWHTTYGIRHTSPSELGTHLLLGWCIKTTSYIWHTPIKPTPTPIKPTPIRHTSPSKLWTHLTHKQVVRVMEHVMRGLVGYTPCDQQLLYNTLEPNDRPVEPLLLHVPPVYS
jgi:hypothetical protein